MILCSYRAQIPVLIITSKQSFLEFLDPKDEGSKLLQNISNASHLKDSNFHQHYHQKPQISQCNVSFHLSHTYLNKGVHALATTVHNMRIQDKAWC